MSKYKKTISEISILGLTVLAFTLCSAYHSFAYTIKTENLEKTTFPAKPVYSSKPTNPARPLTPLKSINSLKNLNPSSAKTTTLAKSTPVNFPFLRSPWWNPRVKRSLNDLILHFGKMSKNYNFNDRPYIIIDFNNTLTIGNADEQLAIYQLEHLNFGIPPSKIKEILCSGIPDINRNLGSAYNNITVSQVVGDIANAYSRLYARNLVHADINPKEEEFRLGKDPDWKEFSTKMYWLYSAILNNFGDNIAYPWLTYWFTGLSPQQVTNLATSAFKYYKKNHNISKFWTNRTWTCPANYMGRQVGALSISFRHGVAISHEMRELARVMSQNGIDVWISSSSATDVLNAAMRTYDLPMIKGVLALRCNIENGKYKNGSDGSFAPKTHGIGKSDMIERLLFPVYKGKGPLLVAGDSGDDFNMATEFADNLVVLLINRILPDSSSVLSAIAISQEEKKINLMKSIEKGEPLILLQGRDENCGMFWAKSTTRKFGETRPELLSTQGELWKTMINAGINMVALINNARTLTEIDKNHKGLNSRGELAPFSSYLKPTK